MAERDVLIVDDDARAGDLLCQIFGAAGYPCRLVGDGGEALEVFKVWRPPLVVTDVLHPGITGIDLLRQVRAVDGDVAVIVQTGAASVKTAIASLKLGAHAFLLKPINIDELLIATERALERRQLLIERRERQRAHGQRQEAPDAAVLVLGGTMDLKIHAACLKLGAYAHLWKPVLMEELLIAAERAIERRQLLIERRQREEGA